MYMCANTEFIRISFDFWSCRATLIMREKCLVFVTIITIIILTIIDNNNKIIIYIVFINKYM